MPPLSRALLPVKLRFRRPGTRRPQLLFVAGGFFAIDLWHVSHSVHPITRGSQMTGDQQAAKWDRARDLRKHMPTYTEWLAWVRVRFEQPEEFLLAVAIYSFMDDFHEGHSPYESYRRFDRWAKREAA